MSAHPAPSAAALAMVATYSVVVAELHRVSVDMGVFVAVVGDPDNACYEWTIERGGQVLAHSNVGYGGADIALRDGLIAYHGLGSQLSPVDLPDSPLPDNGRRWPG